MLTRLALVCGLISFVGCRDSNRTERHTRRPMPQPIAEIDIDSKTADVALATGLEIRSAIRDGRVTLIPIVATTTPSGASYITLDEGMRAGAVSVRELAEWDVATVSISNTSSQPLLVLGGELIFDGMQDRTLAESRVIAPGTVEHVHVNCVEIGRDEGGHTFHDSHLMVELPLRHILRFDNQQKVWDTVAAINRRLGLTPPSQTYRLAALRQNNGEMATRRDHLVQQLEAAPDHERIVGIAIAYDGEIVAIDRFVNHNLFEKLAPELVGSYVAGDDGKPHEGNQPSGEVLRDFIKRGTSTTTDASTEVFVR